MRKVTQEIVSAFNYGSKLKRNNTETDGKRIWLHGNLIAEKRQDGVYITNAGWFSDTTKERLNGLSGVSISQKNWEWFLNGKKWDGSWIKVSSNNDAMDSLRSVAMVAKLGDLLINDQKESNDWKTRMLKAGLENKGLIMPENWDQLPEEEKQRRLDGAIDNLL